MIQQLEAASWTVQTVPLVDADDSLIAAWRELSEAAADSCPFLSPDFVLPSTSLNNDTIQLVAIRNRHTAQLDGLLATTDSGGNRFIPCRHQAAYLSQHSFRSGILARDGLVDEVVSAFLDWLEGEGRKNRAISFDRFLLSSPVWQAIETQCAARGLGCHVDWWFERAAITRVEGEMIASPETESKTLKRVSNRFKKLGEHELIVHDGKVDDSLVQRFLELEDASWKGENGSSMLANPLHSWFFHEMTERFSSQNRTLWFESQLNGQTVALTAHYWSGTTDCAFKLAWDYDYSKFSLGVVQEVAVVNAFNDVLPHLTLFDSSTTVGSFVNKIWTHRIPIGRTAVTVGKWTDLLMHGSRSFRAMRRAASRAVRSPSTANS